MNSSHHTIRWGIVGCGDVTEQKSGPALQTLAGSAITAVMRRDAVRAADYAARHGIARWYTNAADLINDPEVDAVYVATPPSTHAKYTLMALEAGKPVYCEKPMALTYAECMAMIDTAKRTNKKLFIAYYRRALPEFAAIKKMIDDKIIGDVRTVHVHLQMSPRPGDKDTEKHWHVIPDISGGGHFADLAPHQFDLMEFFFGPVKSVRSFAVNQAGYYVPEDAVTLTFCFENGILGTGNWCFTTCDSCRIDETLITGSQGSIRFSTFDHHPVILTTAGQTQTLTFERPAHIQQPLIETVLQELRGEAISPCDAESAARTTRLIQWALDEYYSRSNT